MQVSKIEARVDVLAVNLITHKVRFLVRDQDARNAESIVHMAVMRRGVDEECYFKASVGVYAEGDIWRGLCK